MFRNNTDHVNNNCNISLCRLFKKPILKEVHINKKPIIKKDIETIDELLNKLNILLNEIKYNQ